MICAVFLPRSITRSRFNSFRVSDGIRYTSRVPAVISSSIRQDTRYFTFSLKLYYLHKGERNLHRPILWRTYRIHQQQHISHLLLKHTHMFPERWKIRAWERERERGRFHRGISRLVGSECLLVEECGPDVWRGIWCESVPQVGDKTDRQTCTNTRTHSGGKK